MAKFFAWVIELIIIGIAFYLGYWVVKKQLKKEKETGKKTNWFEFFGVKYFLIGIIIIVVLLISLSLWWIYR